MARKIALKTLIANSTAAVALFGALSQDFRTAMRDASRATVAAIVGGEDAEAAIERAKIAFDYAAKDKKQQGTFRQWATDVRTVAGAWGSMTDEQRTAFETGETVASSLASAIKKPERDAAKAAKAAEKEAAEAKAERDAAAAAPRVITPQEMGVHFAAWVDTLTASTKVTKAQSKALETVLHALGDYRARLAEAATVPATAVAKAA